MLQATDQLHSDTFIDDETWERLTKHYDTRQMMDIVFTVGQYSLVSMMLNTFQVPLDAGLSGFDR